MERTGGLWENHEINAMYNLNETELISCGKQQNIVYMEHASVLQILLGISGLRWRGQVKNIVKR